VGPAEHVRSFYAALDAGDAAGAAAHLAQDATDDRPDGARVTGAAAIAAERLDDESAPDSGWSIDAMIADGERVAVQCTVSWRDPDTGDREVECDSEWLTLHDGLIAEIRAYRGGDDEDDGPALTDDDFDWSLLETGDDL